MVTMWRSATSLLPLVLLLGVVGTAAGLEVADRRVRLSNTTVAAEFAGFGFGAGGKAVLRSVAKQPADAVANVTLLGCTEAETAALYAASAAALCRLTCTYALRMGPAATAAANVSWTLPQHPAILHFVATNLDCGNSSATPHGPKTFVLLLAYSFTTPGSPNPQLPIQDAVQPELHIALTAIAIACALLASAAWAGQRCRTGRAPASERIPFFAVLFAALVCAALHALCGRLYWASFATSGVPTLSKAYLANLFNAAAHTLAFVALHEWLRGRPTLHSPAPYLRLDLVWAAAGFAVVSLCYAFYQSSLHGWSAGAMISVVVVWASNALLCMAESKQRSPHSEYDAASDDDGSVPATTVSVATTTLSWTPWMWFVGVFAAVEVVVIAVPTMLSWVHYWARFEPAVLAMGCLGAWVLLLRADISRPPRSHQSRSSSVVIDVSEQQKQQQAESTTQSPAASAVAATR